MQVVCTRVSHRQANFEQCRSVSPQTILAESTFGPHMFEQLGATSAVLPRRIFENQVWRFAIVTNQYVFQDQSGEGRAHPARADLHRKMVLSFRSHLSH